MGELAGESYRPIQTRKRASIIFVHILSSGSLLCLETLFYLCHKVPVVGVGCEDNKQSTLRMNQSVKAIGH